MLYGFSFNGHNIRHVKHQVRKKNLKTVIINSKCFEPQWKPKQAAQNKPVLWVFNQSMQIGGTSRNSLSWQQLLFRLVTYTFTRGGYIEFIMLGSYGDLKQQLANIQQSLECLRKLEALRAALLSQSNTRHLQNTEKKKNNDVIHDHIKVSDIDPGSGYGRMVLPAMRRQATTFMQRSYRSGKKRTKKNSYSIDDKKNSTGKPLSMSFIKEPTDYKYIAHIAKTVASENYHKLLLGHPDFTRCLFKTFRLKQITTEQFLTAKLLHDAVFAFNSSTLNTTQGFQGTGERYLSRHMLETGPYRAKLVSYCSQEHLRQLQQYKSQQAYHYYTIKLDLRQLHEFAQYVLFRLMQRRVYLPGVIDALVVYLKMIPNVPGLAEWWKSIVLTQPYSSYNELIAVQDYLCGLLNKHPALKLKPLEPGAEKGSMQFLASLLLTTCQIPSIVVEKNSATGKDEVCFVIPSMAMLHLLQTIFHDKKHRVQAQPIVGHVDTRLMRAMDEIPANRTKQPWPKSTEQLHLLYPSQLILTGSARPVEIVHPDLSANLKPHDLHIYPFFLTWHDLFHVWRSSENDKTVYRHLRQLHTTKYQLTKHRVPHLMTKTVWRLTDFDLSLGHKIKRQKKDRQDNKVIRSHKFEQAEVFLHGLTILADYAKVFSVDQWDEDNDLLLYDMEQQPERWSAWLPNVRRHLTFIQSHQKNFTSRDIHLARQFGQFYADFEARRKRFLKASLLQLIVIRLIDEQATKNPEELQPVLLLDLKKYIYWSKNTGLYFYKTVLDKVDISFNQQLKANKASTLLRVMTILYLTELRAALKNKVEVLKEALRSKLVKNGFKVSGTRGQEAAAQQLAIARQQLTHAGLNALTQLQGPVAVTWIDQKPQARVTYLDNNRRGYTTCSFESLNSKLWFSNLDTHMQQLAITLYRAGAGAGAGARAKRLERKPQQITPNRLITLFSYVLDGIALPWRFFGYRMGSYFRESVSTYGKIKAHFHRAGATWPWKDRCFSLLDILAPIFAAPIPALILAGSIAFGLMPVPLLVTAVACLSIFLAIKSYIAIFTNSFKIHSALDSGHLAVAAYLVRNNNPLPAFLRFAGANNLENMKFIWCHAKNPQGLLVEVDNTTHCSAFVEASKHGHLEIVKFIWDNAEQSQNLLTAVDAITKYNALMQAVFKGHLEIVKFIWQNAAQPQALTMTRNRAGQIPFMMAVAYGRVDIAEFILKHSDDKNVLFTTKCTTRAESALSFNNIFNSNQAICVRRHMLKTPWALLLIIAKQDIISDKACRDMGLSSKIELYQKVKTAYQKYKSGAKFADILHLLTQQLVKTNCQFLQDLCHLTYIYALMYDTKRPDTDIVALIQCLRDRYKGQNNTHWFFVAQHWLPQVRQRIDTGPAYSMTQGVPAQPLVATYTTLHRSNPLHSKSPISSFNEAKESKINKSKRDNILRTC